MNDLKPQAKTTKRKLTPLSIFVIYLMTIFFISGFIPFFYLIGFPPFIFDCKVTGISLGDLSNIGQFLSGTSGVLFSISAVLAVVLAFLVQRNQIRQQKRQIDLQIQQIENGKINDDVRNFENNFYQLLNIHRDILISLKYSTPENKSAYSTEKIMTRYYGLEALQKLFDKSFYDTIHAFAASRIPMETPFYEQENFNNAYSKFIEENNNELGHYFRSIFHILKWIYVKRELFEDNGKFYSNIVRAQLSSIELLFLFFNGLSDIAEYYSMEVNFKKLIEFFNFFEHLKLAEFTRKNDNAERNAILALIDSYNKSAYGNRYEKIKKSFDIKSKYCV